MSSVQNLRKYKKADANGQLGETIKCAIALFTFSSYQYKQGKCNPENGTNNHRDNCRRQCFIKENKVEYKKN